MIEIEKEKLYFMYRKMYEIRKFEEAGAKTYKQKFWKGSLHAYIGQEAIAAAAAAVTRPTDYFVSSHRGHGHILAKGVKPDIFMAELFGRLTGQCYGRGGSMHTIDAEKRVFPHGLVGSGAYISAGIGLAINYDNKDDVVLCFSGDGSVNAGGYHEGMNMAAVWHAPVVFICENNGIGVSTHIEDTTSIKNLSQRAIGYGMKGVTVDGTDPLVMYETLKKAVDEVRETKMPIMVEAVCYRAVGHTCWDNGSYRSPEENRRWEHYDPIKRLREFMITEGLYTAEEIDGWNQEIEQIIADAVDFAKKSPQPPLTVEEASKYLYV